MEGTSECNAEKRSESSQIPPPPTTEQHIAPTGAFPGALTPGWNDPPPLASDNYSNVHGRRPRLDPRKRVGLPMDGSNIEATGNVLTARPVAKVTPQRLNMPTDAGNINGNDVLPPRLPPLAPGYANTSKLPVAKVPPRQK